MVPFPTVAALPSYGVITLSIGSVGLTPHAMNRSDSINRFAPTSASSAS